MHLALQHVEAAVNVGGDADCTADVSMAGLHLLLQKAYRSISTCLHNNLLQSCGTPIARDLL